MTKADLRDELLGRRRSMSPDARAKAADAIASHLLTVPAIVRSTRVACYLSMPSEPGTGPVISTLLERGIEVVVPLSLADQTLDWVAYDPVAPAATTPLGMSEPAGSRLGTNALETCDVVIVPALAVDLAGHRLGRGAGYYDRALSGVRAPLCALVFTHELLPDVPHEGHDVRVNMVVTPSGLFRVP